MNRYDKKDQPLALPFSKQLVEYCPVCGDEMPCQIDMWTQVTDATAHPA